MDDVLDSFKAPAKKRKSKKPKDTEGEATEEAVTAEGNFDPSAAKKKKKKKASTTNEVDDFEAKLAEAGVGDEAHTATTAEEQEGDMEKGTGIWSHGASQPISYPLLLTRFFTILQNNHPALLSSTKSYKIPPPMCLREGNKKTIFANIADICKRMKRSDEHVTQFLFGKALTDIEAHVSTNHSLS